MGSGKKNAGLARGWGAPCTQGGREKLKEKKAVPGVVGRAAPVNGGGDFPLYDGREGKQQQREQEEIEGP